MQETKSWWQSKTIWGIVIALLAVLFKAVGIDAPVLPENADAEQIQAYYEAVKAADGNITALISTGISVVGFALALWGRIKAETKIS